MRVGWDHSYQDLAPDPHGMFPAHFREIPRFSLCFWPLYCMTVVLSHVSSAWYPAALGGPPKPMLCTQHVLDPWCSRLLGCFPASMTWRGEVFTQKNRFSGVPNHLYTCGQTSKKIVVQTRSISTVHLEMFLSGLSLSGFSPCLVLSEQSLFVLLQHEARSAEGLSGFVLLRC